MAHELTKEGKIPGGVARCTMAPVREGGADGSVSCTSLRASSQTCSQRKGDGVTWRWRGCQSKNRGRAMRHSNMVLWCSGDDTRWSMRCTGFWGFLGTCAREDDQ
jgi:hypothetical protein